LGKCLVYRHSEKEHLLDLGWNGGFVAKSGQSSKSPDCICLIISVIRLGDVLDIVKVLKFAFLRNDTFPMAGRATGFTGISGRTCCLLQQNAYENPAVEKTRPSHRFGGPLPLEPRAASLFSLLDFSFISGHRPHSRGKCRDFPRERCTFHRGWCRKFGL